MENHLKRKLTIYKSAKMKRLIELLILICFITYFIGDIFYSRVIEKNWKVYKGEYPEKAEITFNGSYVELNEFLPKKSTELLENAYSLMGIENLSEYNRIVVGDWEKAFFFSLLASDAGSTEALVLLGILYAMETEYQNFNKSLEFFREGARSNNVIAKLVLNNIENYKIWPVAEYKDLEILRKVQDELRPKSF